MDPFTILLFSMQAAGAAVGIYDANKRQKMSREAAQVERAGVDANVELITASAEQDSLDAMIALRQSMGAMLAINAARGAGGGSGYALIGASERAFNRDERTRDLNTKTQIASAKARGLVSDMHNLGTQQQIGSQFAQRVLDMIPVSSMFRPQNTNTAKIASNSATSAAVRAAKRASFGLEPVGY